MAFTVINTITIDHTKVGSSSLTNYPMLVSGLYTFLASVANGGVVQNASGFDIGFYADAGLTTKLNWETESWVSNGSVIYWVQVPTVSNVTDTVIYIAAGNAAITTDQSNKAGTWTSNYRAVYHLPNGATLSAADSTGIFGTGTITGATATTGQIDGGALFVAASSQHIDLNQGTTHFNPLTVSAWFKANSLSGVTNVATKGFNGTSTEWQFGLTGNKLYWNTFNAGTVQGVQTSVATIATGVWHHYVGVYDGTAWKTYLDGVLDTSVTAGGPVSTTVGYTIGAVAVPGGLVQYFDGSIDELRIQNAAQSAGQILADYNNQSAPSTFYTLTGMGVVGISVSKVNTYAVLAPPRGVSVSKVNIYAVLNSPTAPSWPSLSFAPGVVGVAYSQAFSAIGTAPITYSLVSGSMPTGLTLNSSGSITGTPTVVGSSSFTLRATNAFGTADQPFTLTVLAGTAGSVLTFAF